MLCLHSSVCMKDSAETICEFDKSNAFHTVEVETTKLIQVSTCMMRASLSSCRRVSGRAHVHARLMCAHMRVVVDDRVASTEYTHTHTPPDCIFSPV